MGFLSEKCVFLPITEELLSESDPFSCGDEDLDNFFMQESFLYQEELLAKSYCFVLAESPKTIVCAFAVSNDSLRVDQLPNSRKKKVKRDIPGAKQMRRYPAVLIGRLGVNKEFHNKHIGADLLSFVKWWFISSSNKTGCRFVLVDAYNKANLLNYYGKNGFDFLFSSEEQENFFVYGDTREKLDTRLMYFDLKKLKSLD